MGTSLLHRLPPAMGSCRQGQGPHPCLSSQAQHLSYSCWMNSGGTDCSLPLSGVRDREKPCPVPKPGTWHLPVQACPVLAPAGPCLPMAWHLPLVRPWSCLETVPFAGMVQQCRLQVTRASWPQPPGLAGWGRPTHHAHQGSSRVLTYRRPRARCP